ncbi:MAG: hypothetical protein IKB60_02585 [Clostridia bacterium]|nr:hypothetical protein [Clostridia bacterium]
MKKFLQIIKISSIFSGAVLGAGFAGGRELVTFFVSFGKSGIIAVFAAGILFTVFGSIILYTAKKEDISSYSNYLNLIFTKNTAFLFGAISEIFLLVCFFIMLAGGGAVFNDIFKIPVFTGSIITALISFTVLSFGLNTIGTVCSIFSPIMLIGILYVNIYSLLTKTTPAMVFFNNMSESVILSAVLYVSYNMLSCAPALVSSASLAENKRTALYGGVLGGIILLTLSFITCLALHLGNSSFLSSELPMLTLSREISMVSYYVYAIVLYMAILTTAFSTGLPLVKKSESLGFSQRSGSFVLCLVSLPLSMFKFSLLIEYCYTFFGYLGIILLCKILAKTKI